MLYNEDSSVLHLEDPKISVLDSVFIQYYDYKLKKKNLVYVYIGNTKALLY